MAEPDRQSALSLNDLPRVLGDRPGRAGRTGQPLLVCIGGLHGNEPCGVHAIRRVLDALGRDDRGLVGRLVGLTGNRAALARNERFLDRDLNRIWTVDDPTTASDEAVREARERREIARELRVLLEVPAGRGRVLDLHSTSGGGSAFTNVDDTLANRALAFGIPVPQVLGLEEELEGTLLGWLNGRGIPAVGFESGQHVDPRSVDRAEAAVWIVMEEAGVLARGIRPEVTRSRSFLLRECADGPEVVEVLHRHPVEGGDGFVMDPGYSNFQSVEAGGRLARDRTGELLAPLDGLILMPLYQGQGEDGFFVVRPVRPAWLRLSAFLRRLRFDRWLAWLPGVRREPGRDDGFVVDRQRARWFALEIFHLLGYRRVTPRGSTLVMRRRERRDDPLRASLP